MPDELAPTVHGRTVPDRVADLELYVRHLREGLAEICGVWNNDAVGKLVDALVVEVEDLKLRLDAQAQANVLLIDRIERLEQLDQGA